MNEINDLAKNPCPIGDLVKAGLLTPVDPGETPPWQDLIEFGGVFYTKGEEND